MRLKKHGGMDSGQKSRRELPCGDHGTHAARPPTFTPIGIGMHRNRLLAVAIFSLMAFCLGIVAASELATVQPALAEPTPMASVAPSDAPQRASYSSCRVDGPYIAMTFDDGPHPLLTPRLLDMLKARGIRATFFLIGQNAAEYPDIVRRIAAEGHEIGNHTWNHPQLTKLNPAALREEIDRTSSTIANWRLANATPAWRSLVRIKISAALPCFLCLVVSICSPLTSKAQGTIEAKTNSLPEWRWEAVIAALEDPSIEVQQAAVEWLAALSEQRYAPPKASRPNDFVNCSKPVSSLRIQMGFMFCERCPGLIPRAPEPRPICSRSPMKASAWPPPRRLEAWAQQRRVLRRRWLIC
jgi:hypothetical protein